MMKTFWPHHPVMNLSRLTEDDLESVMGERLLAKNPTIFERMKMVFVEGKSVSEVARLLGMARQAIHINAVAIRDRYRDSNKEAGGVTLEIQVADPLAQALAGLCQDGMAASIDAQKRVLSDLLAAVDAARAQLKQHPSPFTQAIMTAANVLGYSQPDALVRACLVVVDGPQLLGCDALERRIAQALKELAQGGFVPPNPTDAARVIALHLWPLMSTCQR